MRTTQSHLGLVAAILFATALLAGCTSTRAERPTDVHVEYIEEDGAYIMWNPGSMDLRARVTLRHESGETKPPETTGKGVGWLHVAPLQAGTWTVTVATMVPEGEGERALESEEASFEVAERVDRVQLILDQPATDSTLNLSTLLLVSGAGDTSDAARKVRDHLELAGRHLGNQYLGPTYLVPNEDEIDKLQSQRDRLMADDQALSQLPALLGAPIVLVVDIRAPDPEAPQLAVRMYDVTARDKQHEAPWHKRPLVFEEFLELDPDVVVTSNRGREHVYRRLRAGIEKLIEDPLVQRYASEVKANPDEFDASAIYQEIGYVLQGEPGDDVAADIEAKVLFPESATGIAGTVEGSAKPDRQE